MKAIIPALAFGLALHAQAPDAALPFLQARSMSTRPVLAEKDLPALPSGNGRPEAAFSPTRDWEELLWKAAKKGRLPARFLPTESEVSGTCAAGPGWTAYLVVVPAGGTLTARLDHPAKDQFRLEAYSVYADLTATVFLTHGAGKTPQLRYRNPGDGWEVVTLMVQDPNRRSGETPFRLTLQRSWTEADATPRRPLDPRMWALSGQP